MGVGDFTGKDAKRLLQEMEKIEKEREHLKRNPVVFFDAVSRKSAPVSSWDPSLTVNPSGGRMGKMDHRLERLPPLAILELGKLLKKRLRPLRGHASREELCEGPLGGAP